MTQQIYAGPVFVHAHTWPEAEVTWNTSGGPPHTPVQQVIAAWLFEPQHINAGNLRRVLYHEAAHVLGYQHDHQISTDDFAEACMEAEDSPSSVSSFEENRPYVKGDLDGHMADDQSEPSWCLVRWWYIIETEQLVAVEILGCY